MLSTGRFGGTTYDASIHGFALDTCVLDARGTSSRPRIRVCRMPCASTHAINRLPADASIRGSRPLAMNACMRWTLEATRLVATIRTDASTHLEATLIDRPTDRPIGATIDRANSSTIRRIDPIDSPDSTDRSTHSSGVTRDERDAIMHPPTHSIPCRTFCHQMHPSML